MRRILAMTICAASSLIVSGCFTPHHYSLTAQPVAGLNTPDRLTGTWTYSIDESIKDARRSGFKPMGNVCGLHTYSLDASSSIEGAIRKAMQDFLENGSEQAGSPRHIAFKLDSFNPRFSCV